MAEKLRDYPINDFSGGFVLNKSDYELNRNEFVNTQNFDLDERGRAKVRGGSQQFGTAIGQSLNYLVAITNPSSNINGLVIAFDKGANSNAYVLVSTSLNADINVGDTSATVMANGNFAAATSTFEVNGDIITYTAKPSGTSFTITSSTILKKHLQASSVNQWGTANATGIDSRAGIYGATLGGLLFLCGGVTAFTTTDGVSFSAVTASNGLFATTYRDRIYVAGSNIAGGTGTNVAPYRLSWSNAGTAATWTAADFQDVFNQQGESISGLKVHQDRLLIFTPNTTFYYDETRLRQSNYAVGAYNHHVVKEIDGVLYTFCPGGVFAGNGSTYKKISEPVENWLRYFFPKYDTTYTRVIENAFAFTIDKKYCLFLTNIYLPDPDHRTTTKTNIVLVYDTKKANWTSYLYSTSLSVPQFALSTSAFSSGGSASAYTKQQLREAVFMVNDVGTVYKLFDSLEQGFDSGLNARGTLIFADNVANTTGKEISCILETPFIDLGNPSWWKRFEYLRILVEQGDFQVSYQLDKGDRITDWISLGYFNTPNERKKLKDQDGFRIKLRVTCNQLANQMIFNGMILEDIYAISKDERRYVTT